MLDAIKYITEVAGLKYRIEDSAVIITPIDAPIGNIITRMYPVQPSFIDVVVERQGMSAEERDQDFVSMSDRVTVTKSDVKDFFEKTGVKFPSGASITYNSGISQLIVANTADNLETFERILQQLNVVPNQVEIEARFIEVDQGDLEELGLQWILNDNYEFATKNDGSGQRLQVNANRNGVTQGNRFFSYNSGNLNVQPASMITQTANQTMLGGILSASSVLTNPEVTVVLQALSQHGGTDLLSAPRVTTRSGVNAQIQVVKEIIYPTEFDVTQPTMNSDGNVTMSPVVTPGTFETRETGVILNVTPTVGPDGYTIDLVMAPEVAELVDWIQYGSQITVETGIIGAKQQNTYLFNMPQPIFTSRNVTTSIVIWDGQTVVMGGLIREELTTIKDKIPILGDIPLLGWLFRSEGEYSQKKNLLIFVTARLVDPAGRPIHTEGSLAMPGTGIDAEAADAAAPAAL
jgi:general secretion pathway protein D